MKVTNTAIINKAYFDRGLMPHGAATPNVVRQTDGTLWAAIRGHHERGTITLYRSGDLGFSWENIFRDTFPSGTGWGFENTTETDRFHGAFVSLNIFEHIDRLIVWLALERRTTDQIIEQPQVWPWIFELSTGTQITGEPFAPPSNYTGYEINADSLNIKVVYNQNRIYVFYLQNGEIRTRTFEPHQPITQQRDVGTGINYVDHDEHARQDQYVDVAVVNESESIYYRTYNDTDGSFSTEQFISSGNMIRDLNIARNNNGDLMVVWSDGGHPHSAFSEDDGASWSTEALLNPATPYVDPVTGETVGRVHLQPGLDTFLTSVTGTDQGQDKTYVAQITGGLIQDYQQIATQSNPEADVVGAKFFQTSDYRYLDLSNPPFSRVAFQVGNGNVSNTKPVRFGQESLDESAFMEVPDDPIKYSPGSDEYLVNVNVLRPDENIDYYEQGATGQFTDKNIAAINKIGTDITLKKYEPSKHAETDDRSAYGQPQEYLITAEITSLSYDQPFAATQDSFKEFIERDVRQIILPPNFHLTRDVILNDGNFLKRTVWTAEWVGNEYEVTQVVPSFVRNQIANYKANMYVIGPSRDPFSRVVLPSET